MSEDEIVIQEVKEEEERFLPKESNKNEETKEEKEENSVKETVEEENIEDEDNKKSLPRRIWGGIVSGFSTAWDWGDYYGEKIAWVLGITEPRYYDQILEAQRLREEMEKRRDEETGWEYPIRKEMPNFNEFPEDTNLVDYFYKKGIEKTKTAVDNIGVSKAIEEAENPETQDEEVKIEEQEQEQEEGEEEEETRKQIYENPPKEEVIEIIETKKEEESIIPPNNIEEIEPIENPTV